jgi:hypothetical protein
MQRRILEGKGSEALAARRAEQQQTIAMAVLSGSGGSKKSGGGGGGAGISSMDADEAPAAAAAGGDGSGDGGALPRGWVATGQYVTLHIAAATRGDDGVSFSEGGASDAAAFDAMALATHGSAGGLGGGGGGGGGGSAAPLTLHGLHPHENRLSLLNCHVQKAGPLFLPTSASASGAAASSSSSLASASVAATDDDGGGVASDVVASKETLWFVCGFRRWCSRPVFSQNNLNCDKHKFERFLQGGTGHFAVASTYGPATYAPAPVLVFRELPAAAAGAGAAMGDLSGGLGAFGSSGSGSRFQLVASGSLGSVDVDRIVLKRIVITGYPVRVHKRTAVIKHMFYNPQVSIGRELRRDCCSPPMSTLFLNHSPYVFIFSLFLPGRDVVQAGGADDQVRDVGAHRVPRGDARALQGQLRPRRAGPRHRLPQPLQAHLSQVRAARRQRQRWRR